MNEEELPVSNEFITFVRIQLDHEQKQQLNRFLNLHYLGSYLATKLFQYTPKPYKPPQPKEYKNPFDPEDPSTWNYSYSRLMRTYD